MKHLLTNLSVAPVNVTLFVFPCDFTNKQPSCNNKQKYGCVSSYVLEVWKVKLSLKKPDTFRLVTCVDRTVNTLVNVACVLNVSAIHLMYT